MDFQNLLSKPIGLMTGEEFLQLSSMSASPANFVREQAEATASTEPRYVYGIAGIAQLFGCSKVTANRIKKSGRIDAAIKQIGRKIVVDAELALELAGRKLVGRRRKS